MAVASGISYSGVQRIWRAHGLKPHLMRSCKLSRDPNFVAKVEDIVGLYLNPPDKALVLAVDEKSQIQALDRCFHLHFTPTSGSSINMVERFFAEITRKRIRHGVFKSVEQLEQAIMDYLAHHNASPKPYVWTKSATEIFGKVARAKQVLESQH